MGGGATSRRLRWLRGDLCFSWDNGDIWDIGDNWDVWDNGDIRDWRKRPNCPYSPNCPKRPCSSLCVAGSPPEGVWGAF